MRLKLFFAIGIMLTLLQPVISQDTSLKPSGEGNAEVQYNKILLIPFEPKLYMSDIDRDVAAKSNMRFTEIRGRFRQGLTDAMFVETMQQHKAVSMLSDDPEIAKDLNYIYMSVGYHYKEMPIEETPEEKTSGIQSLMNKAKKAIEPKQPEPGTRIENGQLASYADNKERYMNIKIINLNMLDYLSKKYEADLFLFITQLDIKKAADTDYRDLEAENYKREVKVHYSIIDKDGNEIGGGAAKTYFSSRENDIDRIMKTNFTAISQQVGSKLPQPQLTQAARQKREEEARKAREQEDLIRQY